MLVNRITALPASSRVPVNPLFRAQWAAEAAWRLWHLDMLCELYCDRGEAAPEALIEDVLHAEKVANWVRAIT